MYVMMMRSKEKMYVMMVWYGAILSFSFDSNSLNRMPLFHIVCVNPDPNPDNNNNKHFFWVKLIVLYCIVKNPPPDDETVANARRESS